MGRIARRVLLAAALSVLLAEACLSPTLPMPPPAEPDIEGPTAERMVMLSGRVPEAQAMVWAINWTQVESGDTRAIGGDWADEDGAYRFEIRGEIGDRCELWFERGGDQSQSRYFEIPDPE